MREENSENKNPESEEKEIDILELVYKLWSRKKLLLVWALWGVVTGLVIAFSIPREYTTTVKLAPEYNGTSRSISGGLGALASMAGFNTSRSSSVDAVFPQLYPDIVSSVPFATSLFDVVVEDKDGNNYTVKDYLTTEISSPWWGGIMKLPGKVIGLLRPKEEENVEADHQTSNFQLTAEEMALVTALGQRITANVDQKTNVIIIDTKMQDPMVSAILADTVVARLREYITTYRTDKARKDLEYAMKLNDEAKEAYYESQQRLADYMDRNQNLATRTAQVTRERLQNEASLAFNLYNETSLQVQHAKSKVQETTPVYTILTPATVPIRPTSPRKGLILAGCVFLSIVACAAWILFGSSMVEEYKKKGKKPEEDSEIEYHDFKDQNE